MTARGRLALVLHAHLPFVRHPEHRRFLEEHWLYEAITDCYLPLIKMLRGAAARGSCFRLTLSVSPTLLSMLRDPLLKQRYLDYLGRLIRVCERELACHRDADRRTLTRYYHDRIVELRGFYVEELGSDPVRALAELESSGLLELMTTGATHGFLPLLRSEPAAVRAQLGVARDYFRDTFGRPPRGLWLPECGYYPGLEAEVARAGYRYVILDAHGLQQARPRPRAGVYAPIESNGVAVFGRDPESAREVWSRDSGYPGHPLYREYHRDLGYEPDAAASLAGFLPPGVVAAPTGLKYFRVTGGAGPKVPYVPSLALHQAERDAARFLEGRRQLLARVGRSVTAPIVVAPYDAELFGHWWFEGPAFLDSLSRYLDAAPDLEPVTLGGYLARFGTASEGQPAASTWGEQGYNGAWLRPETGWVYLRLHQAASELKRLVLGLDAMPPDARRLRTLRQAGRSLLLAQGSDWTFQMGRDTRSDYAESVIRDQLARFGFLTGAFRGAATHERQLAALEGMDNLFPHLDLGHFV
ncbi:MAG: 1,4-alpha-glucan branching protein domain-containing protein [Chromatiaceae bacterium]